MTDTENLTRNVVVATRSKNPSEIQFLCFVFCSEDIGHLKIAALLEEDVVYHFETNYGT
jgi:hypothetical protein